MLLTQIPAPKKLCCACGQMKPLDDFYLKYKNTQKHQSRCKPCGNAYLRERYGWGPRRVPVKGKRDRHLRDRYGITRDEWDALLEKQGNQCPVCQTSPTRYVTDHDHKTGKVRALLCYRCNLFIGYLETCPGLTDKAVAYLKEHA